MAEKKIKEKKEKKKSIPKFDRDLTEYTLQKGFNPGPTNPLCLKCGLHNNGARKPYMRPSGADKHPLITVVVDSVSKGEDEAGVFGATGTTGLMRKLMQDIAPEIKLDMSMVRFLPLTRCSAREGKVNFKTKGNWCRWFAVDDLVNSPPEMVIAIGTTALGALCHKSNAQDWSGRLLTWRGWPDDWLMNPKYNDGHPHFGKRPGEKDRIPLFALQSPRLIYGTQNPRVIKKWKDQVKTGLTLAVQGVKPLIYDRPWWRLVTDPDEIERTLNSIRDLTKVQYDTETTGLEPFRKDSKIVFHMFRWNDENGVQHSIGFPWDYPTSAMLPFIKRLTPIVLRTLSRCKIEGHNLTFDILFNIGTMEGAELNTLAKGMNADTLHMLYTIRQDTGSRGLDIVAYEWAPTLAGYEEEMVLLIGQMPELLDPSAGQGGHYANCPADKWDSHLKPYVMGDVEVVAEAVPTMRKRLETARIYQIPLAHPTISGKFRWYEPPKRDWVYDNIMLPAQRTLTAMMARGMHVNVNEVALQEDLMPKAISGAKQKLRESHPKIIQWAEQQEATDPEWKFDLESKDQLKTVLYDLMAMPVKRLTKAGRQTLGDLSEKEMKQMDRATLMQFASADKFTLSSLSVAHPEVRPLIDYRKQHKAYTTYVRSMRNHFDALVDKKKREKPPYLMDDMCVHAQFNQTGTRSGRLSSSNPNLQQLPRESLVKRMYDSRFGADGVLYQGDLSQIELRLIACACGDPSMVKAYWDRVDLHSLTASKVYRIEYEKFQKDYWGWLQKNGKDKEAKDLESKRKVAKIVNFLTGYGGGPLGLQTSLAQQSVYLKIEECEDIIESFFDAYPSLRRHIGLYKDFILKNGVAVSIFGRVRIFEEVFSDDNESKSKALRSGYNHMIQSTASDMMLVCITVIEHLMRDMNLESMLVSTVHDSLVIDARRNELQKVHEICDQVINNIPEILSLFFGEQYDRSWIITPIEGDFEVGKNYLDQKKVIADASGSVDWDRILSDTIQKK
jgi:DNA polymerase I-like protein with 3'-5' exonuclease and polymerase domains